jgi:dipeptidyl aminopeptidase/acylaminoacyl peptidase
MKLSVKTKVRRPFIALAMTSLATTSIHAKSVHSYSDLSLSPNGDVVATVEADNSGTHAKVLLRKATDGQILRVVDPCSDCAYSDLTFASDGGLAFLARSHDGRAVTLELLRSTTAQPVAVSTISGIAQMPRFSPRADRIALLVTIGATKQIGATEPGAPLVGEIGVHPDEQRLAVFDIPTSAATAQIKLVSPPDRYIYEYDWLPDGRGFVVSDVVGDGDSQWWIASLDAIDAQTGNLRTIVKPFTQISRPRVSPDGSTVAFIGGLMSDFGPIGGDVWTVPLAGGVPTNLTHGMAATANSVAWENGALLVTALDKDATQILRISPEGARETLWSKPWKLDAGEDAIAFSADERRMAAVAQDYEHAPAIMAGPIQAPRQITQDNAGVASIVSARSITWNSDGRVVQGWILSPVNMDSSIKHPMIVNVHGGPANAWVPNFIMPDGITAKLVKAGYIVFFPNPRGSFGQGEDFTAANRGDFGGGDFRDIMAGVDRVETIAPVDDERLGIMGLSYGGYMSLWANTQTNRFKAIVAGAGISDFVSYYGTNGIEDWMLPYFGKSMYEDPAAYARVSPITYIRKAKTPTFLYVGDRDVEVPASQSIEYWQALRHFGIPTSLLIYAGEGHSIRDPAHTADWQRRALAWFNTYLRPRT